MQGIAECTQLLAMRLGVRIWYEWVDSGANPSDGLSRLGLQCPLFGSQATDAQQPAWQFLACTTDRLRTVATAPTGDLVK